MSSVTAKTTYLVTQTGFSHLSHWTGNGDIFAPLRFSSCVENGHMHLRKNMKMSLREISSARKLFGWIQIEEKDRPKGQTKNSLKSYTRTHATLLTIRWATLQSFVSNEEKFSSDLSE